MLAATFNLTNVVMCEDNLRDMSKPLSVLTALFLSLGTAAKHLYIWRRTRQAGSTESNGFGQARLLDEKDESASVAHSQDRFRRLFWDPERARHSGDWRKYGWLGIGLDAFLFLSILA